MKVFHMGLEKISIDNNIPEIGFIMRSKECEVKTDENGKQCVILDHGNLVLTEEQKMDYIRLKLQELKKGQ